METQTKVESGEKMKGKDLQKITPFIWFDHQAEEAVAHYISVFKKSGIVIKTFYGETAAIAAGRPQGSVMTIGFRLEGQEFNAINGGPVFEITPSISFFVNCNTAEEIDNLWKNLSSGGSVLMELDKYPFSERFGWLKDRFGVTWQLNLAVSVQNITPFLMFVGEQNGNAEEAMNFYISLFRNSEIRNIERFGPGEAGGIQGAVRHARFSLDNQEFMAMDSNGAHNFTFTPAISLVVNCETQEEIDFYWDRLSRGGNPEAQQCGWLQDKYGVSWQVVPTVWKEMLRKADPEKSEKLMQVLLRMKKIDLLTLQRVFEHS